MLLQLDGFLRDAFDDIDGPLWNQKLYVAYRIGNYNWLAIGTQATVLILSLNVKAGAFDRSELAQRLGVEEFDKEYSLADNSACPALWP
jgi:predicted transport protein